MLYSHSQDEDVCVRYSLESVVTFVFPPPSGIEAGSHTRPGTAALFW